MNFKNYTAKVFAYFWNLKTHFMFYLSSGKLRYYFLKYGLFPYFSVLYSVQNFYLICNLNLLDLCSIALKFNFIVFLSCILRNFLQSIFWCMDSFFTFVLFIHYLVHWVFNFSNYVFHLQRLNLVLFQGCLLCFNIFLLWFLCFCLYL